MRGPRHVALIVWMLCAGGTVFGQPPAAPLTAVSSLKGDTAVIAEQARFLLIDPDRFAQARETLGADFSAMPGSVIAAGVDTARNRAIVVSVAPSGDLAVSRLSITGSQSKALLPLTTKTELRTFDQPPSAITASKPPDAAALNQRGRVYFMTHTTFKSLPLALWAVNTAFAEVNDQVNVGISLLSVGASLYGGYRFTKNRELGYGKVAMMNYGGELGVAYPILFSWFLGRAAGINESAKSTDIQCLDTPSGRVCDTVTVETSPLPEARVRAWGAMLGFPLGIWLGAITDFVDNDAYGNASIIRTLSRSGALYGFVIPNLFNLDDDSYMATGSALSMALIPAGFYLGSRLVDGGDYSAGRAISVGTGAVMGSLTGLFAPALFDRDAFSAAAELYAATTLLGHAAGTWFGFAYQAHRPYSLGQGVFHALSATVGVGVGAALPFLFQADDHRPYVAAMTIGGWGGFILGERLSLTLFDDSDEKRAASGVDIDFPLFGEAPLFLAGAYGGMARERPVRARVVQLRF
jgi:hypothetical protein